MCGELISWTVSLAFCFFLVEMEIFQQVITSADFMGSFVNLIKLQVWWICVKAPKARRGISGEVGTVMNSLSLKSFNIKLLLDLIERKCFDLTSELPAIHVRRSFSWLSRRTLVGTANTDCSSWVNIDRCKSSWEIPRQINRNPWNDFQFIALIQRSNMRLVSHPKSSEAIIISITNDR